MIRKSRILTFAVLATILVLVTPVSAIFAGQGQVSGSGPAEALVRLAENAEQQVKNLIDTVYANETAIEKITDVELFDELEGNVTFYGQGVVTLAKAQDALELLDYEGAIGNATEALGIFREVFQSIHIIPEEAGLQTGQLVDAYGLLEAYSRALERIEQLRELLPEEATEYQSFLDQAEALLNLDAARALLLEGKVTEVTSDLAQANQLISEAYRYLKQQAEESNNFRVNGYLREMEQARERIREQFRYGADQGVDVGAVLESLGYHTESEFMQALENMTQTAQGKIGDIDSVIQDLEALGQMIRQMNQTLTQEINRYQEQHGTGGSGSGSGTGGSGSGTGSGSGSGSSGSGSGAGTSGSGSGSEGLGTGGSGTGSGSGSSGSGTSVSGAGSSSSGSGYGSGTGSSGSGTSSGSGSSGSGATGSGSGSSSSGSRSCSSSGSVSSGSGSGSGAK
jgi:tetratricopeptide (TPR) repeat protein